MDDYKHSKALCSNKFDLPAIPLQKSTSILKAIKPAVSDLFSITARHYTNAGLAGLVHFNHLLNTFIIHINNATIEELNSVYVLLLYKGHKKDRTLDTSYRTISTCPLLAKGLDLHVRDLFIGNWNSVQAATQFQGEGSSHELSRVSHSPPFVIFQLSHQVTYDIRTIGKVFFSPKYVFSSPLKRGIASK